MHLLHTEQVVSSNLTITTKHVRVAQRKSTVLIRHRSRFRNSPWTPCSVATDLRNLRLSLNENDKNTQPNLYPVSSMEEHTTDNRATLDRNQYWVPNFGIDGGLESQVANAGRPDLV